MTKINNDYKKTNKPAATIDYIRK